jgi:hypothetical protein
MQLRGALIPAAGALIFAVIGVECGLYCQGPIDTTHHLLGPRMDMAEALSVQRDAAATQAPPGDPAL